MRGRGKSDLRWQLAAGVRVFREKTGGYIIHNPYNRAPPLEVSQGVRSVVHRFNRPSTFVDVVVRTARAEHMDPYDTLGQLQPLVARLIGHGILIKANGGRRHGQVPLRSALRMGDPFKHYVVEECIRCLVDSEIYGIRRPKDPARYILKLVPMGNRASSSADAGTPDEFQILEELRGTSANDLVERGSWRRYRFGVLRRADGGSVQREAAHLRTEPAPIRVRQHLLLDLSFKCIRALESIHARGYLHGDIHPGNYILDSTAGICIVDFGCAQRFGPGGEGSGGYRGGVIY